jgi:hypothetical protein
LAAYLRGLISRYAPLFQLRSGWESQRQKSMKESNASPYSKYLWYRSFERERFVCFAGSPIIGEPKKQPVPFQAVHFHPHAHLSESFPLPPRLHSLQAVQRRPLSSSKLCITRRSTGALEAMWFCLVFMVRRTPIELFVHIVRMLDLVKKLLIADSSVR